MRLLGIVIMLLGVFGIVILLLFPTLGMAELIGALASTLGGAWIAALDYDKHC